MRARGDEEPEAVRRAKQEAEPGITLPTAFPYRTELEAAGYTTIEDLAGADLHELEHIARLFRREAQTVLDEYAVPIAP